MLNENPSFFRRLDASGAPLLLARFLVGGYFVYTGLVKLFHPIEFLKQIRLYHMLPEEPAILLNGTAIVLPWLEVFCGTALVLGSLLRGAAAMMIVMLCVFTPAIALRALGVMRETGTPFFEIEFDCGCGGKPEIIWRKLLFNLALLSGAILVLVSGTRRLCLRLALERRDPRPRYCHFCGYAVRNPVAGVCEECRKQRQQL